MEVEITYHKGKLTFALPIHIKRDHLRLVTEIPDEDIVIDSVDKFAVDYQLPSEVRVQAKAMEERFDEIRNLPLPFDDELPSLTQKQKQRIEAFSLRDEIRNS